MSEEDKGKGKVAQPISCGLIMPISALDGIGAEHWAEIKSIITEAICSIPDPKFSVKLVSDADDVGVIQKRIVQNVYSSAIVVCDVSGKNPNVMFELGLRLAFDKPTVIVKDDKTDYSFDTGIIEHIPYPRDLRFPRIVQFKQALADKVVGTYKSADSDPNHSPFLKNFGQFKVASLGQTEVPADKLVIDMLRDLSDQMEIMRRQVFRDPYRDRSIVDTRGLSPTERIILSVRKFMANEGIKEIAEIRDFELLTRFVEADSGAPQFFSGRSEFKKVLEECLRVM